MQHAQVFVLVNRSSEPINAGGLYLPPGTAALISEEERQGLPQEVEVFLLVNQVNSPAPPPSPQIPTIEVVSPGSRPTTTLRSDDPVPGLEVFTPEDPDLSTISLGLDKLSSSSISPQESRGDAATEEELQALRDRKL